MKRFSKVLMSLVMALALVTPLQTRRVLADNFEPSGPQKVNTNGYDVIGGVQDFTVDKTTVTLNLTDGLKTQIKFIDSNTFRYYVNIGDESFLEFPLPRSSAHEATINTHTDDQFIEKYKPSIKVEETDVSVVIKTTKVTVVIDKETSRMTVLNAKGSVVIEEAAPLMYNGSKTVQTLVEVDEEYFYGGGMQNGRFSHKGQSIDIVNTNNWVDGGVASPSPFYWSTRGYGVQRNTFAQGQYDFGKETENVVSTTHNENRFDAYIFVGDNPESILNSYTNITGKPVQQPDYAFYLAHLNCYNRDVWAESATETGNLLDGKYYSERNPGSEAMRPNEVRESLLPKNGNDIFTGKYQIELHKKLDLPLGSFYPNDGYGCGYGQNDTFDEDIKELRAFSDFANSQGIEVGLWTQSNLWPKDINNPQKGERDIQREVQDGGVRAIKTDVAWVGAGYSMALDGIMKGYEAIADLSDTKPMMISLDGWAGSQRYSGMWSGDQTGGNWEYIRFHIPTYIGMGLSGNPTVGSDMDGIFGGKNPVIQTRDFQWKAFTPHMLDMDGWGSVAKNPWAYGEEILSINRAYLKLKAELMPYISTMNKYSSETGMPMVRAMFLEESNKFTNSKDSQYQFMWGDSFLVAPIYQETKMDEDGNDIRNNIYLPHDDTIWFDYFTGEQYQGGSVLNDFDAPLWKTPIFVKNGSIIPMYTENNNPSPITDTNKDGLDKTHRIVEFYANGKTEYNLYEDDGITLNDEGTNTLITSDVNGSTLTLETNKTTGTYSKFLPERSSEYIVNVSKAPSTVKGNVGGKDVTFTEVTSQEEYDKAEGNVYFYNENPTSIINKYADEGTDIAALEINVSPKLYIKSTAKVDVTKHSFKVVVEGFENKITVSPDTKVDTLDAPTNLRSTDITPYTIDLAWDKVDKAVTYDLLIDGILHRNFKTETHHMEDLPFNTPFKIQVRSVNEEGYSEWSGEVIITTSLDPYRNRPEKIDAIWTGGGGYAGTKAQEAVDNDNVSHFHSKDGNDAYSNTFTLDMNKIYEIEKLEYIPRADGGNGTLQEFLIEQSVDGVTWVPAATVGQDPIEGVKAFPAFERNGEIKILEFKTEEKGSEPITARYLRLTVSKSVGGFFTAHEIRPYAKDGDKGQLVGDWNNSGDIDEGDLKHLENYAGIRKGYDESWDSQGEKPDINKDGVIDAYDIAYVARLLDPNFKPGTKDVKGSMFIEADKATAKKGEEVTYTVYGLGMENVYAFSIELPYDRTVISHAKIDNNKTVLSQFMSSYSYNRNHSPANKDTNHIILTNIGNQPLVNGTGEIATFTVRMAADGDTTLVPYGARFVGDNGSTVNAIEDIDSPTLPETENVLGKEDIESLTFTNEFLTTDDGTNGSKLFQNENYFDVLFDGITGGNLAEFKWVLPGNVETFPKEVRVPTTFHIELKEDQPVKKVQVHNRESSNGRIMSAKLEAFYKDEVVHTEQFNEAKNVFEWVLPSDVLVDYIELTPLTTAGTATGVPFGEANRMLSLYEISIITDTEVKVEDITFDAFPEELSLGALTEITATVNPENASNPFYEVISSNDDVVGITTVITKDGYKYFVTGKAEGEVELTVISKENPDIKDTISVKVNNSFDTRLLQEAIDRAELIQEVLYTQDTFEALEKALVEAKVVLDNPSSKMAVDTATINLNTAYYALKLKGSNVDQPNSENLIPSRRLSIQEGLVYADSDYPKHLLDGDTESIWHSPYGRGVTLPIEIVVDLDAVYDIEQVDFLPNTRQRNGDIVRYRIESSLDGVDYSPIVEIVLPYNDSGLVNRTAVKVAKFDRTEARYVKFVILESLGSSSAPSEMNQYASMAELYIYGVSEEIEEIESIEIVGGDKEIKLGTSEQLLINKTSRKVQTVVWSSSDESVVTVDANGLVKAVGEGKAEVTVSSKENKSVSHTIEVDVTPIVEEDLKKLFDDVQLDLDDSSTHPALVVFLAEFHEAVGDVLDALNNGTAVDYDEITRVYIELHDAIKILVHNDSIVELDDLVNLDLSDFDAGTIAEYEKALVEAKIVLADIVNRIDDLGGVLQTLREAYDTLVGLDRFDLNDLIAGVELHLDYFTKQAQKDLKAAVVIARDVLKNATTNKELVDAYNVLKELYDNAPMLALPEIVEELKDYQELLKNIDLDKYTSDSVDAINAISKKLDALLAKEEVEEDAANALLDEIAEVVKGLIEKPVDPTIPVDPEKPTDPVKPVDPEKPTSPETGLPGTGIGSDYSVVILGSMSIVVGLLYLLFDRKRKGTKNNI